MLAFLVLKVLYAPQEVTEVVLPPVSEEENEIPEVPVVPAVVSGELQAPSEVQAPVESQMPFEVQAPVESQMPFEVNAPVESQMSFEVNAQVESQMPFNIEGEFPIVSNIVEGMSCGCGISKHSPSKNLPSGYYAGGYSGSLNEQMLPKKYPAPIPQGIDFKQEHPNLNTMDSFPAPIKGAVWSTKQRLPIGEFDLPEKYPLLSQ
jgi:hypothetical protein